MIILVKLIDLAGNSIKKYVQRVNTKFKQSHTIKIDNLRIVKQNVLIWDCTYYYYARIVVFYYYYAVN